MFGKWNTVLKILGATVPLPLEDLQRFCDLAEEQLKKHDAKQPHDANWETLRQGYVDYLTGARDGLREAKKQLRKGGPIVNLKRRDIWIKGIPRPIGGTKRLSDDGIRRRAMILDCLTRRLGQLTSPTDMVAIHPQLKEEKIVREVVAINDYFSEQYGIGPELIRKAGRGAYYILEQDL